MQADAESTRTIRDQPAGDHQRLGRMQRDLDSVPPRASPALATVVAGEASESDEDDATYSGSTTDSRCSTSQAMSLDGSFSAASTGRRMTEPTRYNSLLHRKLRERNASLRKNLTEMACQPYQNATREITSITQSLIRSQQLVQEVSSTLRRLTNELFQLEDKVETVRHCNIIPDITMNAYCSVPGER
ncbi:uncharacterized protein LOC135373695 [Ornithodoros turicata]|uniref:uncharacterized protein LOC135373695 n=1 Tax=Ornithodoros turicata TaxID=34597 RepID=UPI0031387607